MIHFFINLEYTENPELHQGQDKPSLKAEIMFQLMMATGINRLLTKRSIKEFLLRVGISLHKFGVIKNFFTDDKIVDIEYQGKKIEFYLSDIISLLGMEICDSECHYVKRNKWMLTIDEFWKSAAAGAVVSQIPVIAIEHVSGNKYNVGVNKPGKPNKETVRLAKLFSESAIKIIGDEKIKRLQKQANEWNRCQKEYRIRMESNAANEFDYTSISLEIRNEFYRHIIGAVDIEDHEYQAIINDKNSILARLMYLAWLFTNGHIIEYEISRTDGKKAMDAEVEPIFEKYGNFNCSDYDGLNNLGFGINLFDTYLDYGLDKLAHLLKNNNTENPDNSIDT